MGFPRLASSARLLVVLGVAFCLSSDLEAATKKLKFKGKQLWEKTTGLTILPDEEKDDLSVSSIHHGFFLMLPYSESWVFETSRELPLRAQDDQYVVSIVVEPRRQGETERDRLGAVLSDLEASRRITIRGAEFLEADDHGILRYEARLTSPPQGVPNPWRSDYWTVRQRDGHWVTAHLSFENAPLPAATILRMLGAGFRGDFEVE